LSVFHGVTGVQTCALPISHRLAATLRRGIQRTQQRVQGRLAPLRQRFLCDWEQRPAATTPRDDEVAVRNGTVRGVRMEFATDGGEGVDADVRMLVRARNPVSGPLV